MRAGSTLLDPADVQVGRSEVDRQRVKLNILSLGEAATAQDGKTCCGLSHDLVRGTPWQ
jgi:hypothetical protein